MTGGARTAVGMHGGGLQDVSATDLAVAAMRAALDAAGMAADALGGVVMGAPRHARPSDLAIEAGAAASMGAPEGAPGCRSTATRRPASRRSCPPPSSRGRGRPPVLMAAAESSSQTPLLVSGLRFHARDEESPVVDALNAARLDPMTEEHVILRDEEAAEAAGIGREAQDAWALRSHERARGRRGWRDKGVRRT